jgi:2-dehydropantoate 2-reductase
MKVLIVGTGVIGTIYGWALQMRGVDVTHWVRKPKRELEKNGAKMDVLDERKGFIRKNETVYLIKTISHLDESMHYDLIIVPTNWYQTENVLEKLVAKFPNSFYYLLTSNWTGPDMYDRLLPKGNYILGYPDAGGTIRKGVYWCNIGPEIHIDYPTEQNKAGFEMIERIFSKAEISLDVQENMLHWLWAHNAGATAISLAFQKYRKVESYLRDKRLLKLSFKATRECLHICEKRGAYSDKYPEVAAFKWPLWLVIPLFKFNFRHNESMKRYTAHGENMPMEDILCNFNDILQTAYDYNIPMPACLELKAQILK